METDIIESNRLIAEFMGYKYEDDGYMWCGKSSFSIDDTEYDFSWDWLMPVVERIEELPLMKIPDEKLPQGFEVIIRGNSCTIDYGNGAEGMVHDFLDLWDGSFTGSKIQSIYIAVVAFIKWYNENIK
jgi:hypothetical protein